MKKTMLSYALLLGLSPFLVQCVASEQDLRGIDLRTRTMDNRIAELERLNETVRGQASAQARLGNELEVINNRLLQHQGRMEEAEHQQQRLREDQQAVQQTTSMRLDNIDIALQEIGSRLEELQQNQLEANDELHLAIQQLTINLDQLEGKQERNQRQIQEIREQQAKEAAARAEAAQQAAQQARREAEESARRDAAREERETAARPGPREITPENVKQQVTADQLSTAAPESPPEPAPTPAPPTPAPAPKPEPEPTPPPADDHYSRGVQQMERGEHRQAYTELARYLEETPRGDRAADARFLLGESLYGQEEYELAILEYQKVIADFGGHRRVPEALLRQGMAFEKLREPSTAAIIYERLISEFPDSDQAGEARNLLTAIN